MYRPTMLVLLFLFTAIGCGGCKKGGANSYETPDGALGEVLHSMCEVLERCPGSFGAPIAYRSLNECVAILDFVLTCRLTEEELGDDRSVWGVEKRPAEVDEDGVAACTQWLEAASCDELRSFEGDNPCSNVAVFHFGDDDDDFEVDEPEGTAAVDELCEQNEDCRPQLFCTGGGVNRDAGIAYCRVCRPRAGEGEDCAMTLCVDGMWCRGAQTDEPMRCAPPEVDGFRCYANEQCASGFCNQSLDDGGGWGLCDPGGTSGDPCEDEYRSDGVIQPTCREGFHCEDGTCQPRRPNGQPCSDAYSCEVGNCHEPTGICGAPDGEPCSWDGECAGNACVEQTCGLSDGQCFLDSDCASGEICAGACQPPDCECSGCPVGQCMPSGNAQGCVDDFDCAFGECIDSVCKEPAVGDACEHTGDCYPLQCVNGACATKAGPGQECGSIDSCQEPFLCIDGTCQIMNLTCEPARAGQRCAWLRVCDDSSWCDLLDNVTCKPRANVGEVCQTTPLRGVETCMPGATCTYDESSGDSRCVALPRVGEACTSACADATCVNGMCEGPPIGTPCRYHDDRPCPGELRCHRDREICVPRSEEGGDCEEFTDCAAGLFCENYDSCVPRRSVGEDCRDTYECTEQLWCDRETYTCQPRLQAGSECRSSDDSCSVGTFCPAGVSTCEPANPNGADCGSDQECQSGTCYDYDFCAVSAMCVVPQ